MNWPLTTWRPMNEWLVLGLLVTSLGGAALSGRGAEPGRSRRAIGAAALIALLSGLLFVGLRDARPGPLAAWLAVDELGAIGVALAALITLAAVLGSPRAELEPADLPAVLFKFVSMVLAATARDGRILAVACLLGALPFLREDRARASEHGRGRALVPVVGSVLIAVALFWLPPSFADAATRAGDAPATLLWLGLAIRMGIAPFHGWLPAVFERGRPGTAVMVFAANPAPIVLARVGLPLDGAHAAGSTVFLFLAVCTAVYAAFLTIAQEDLLRAAGWVAVMHSGFVALGLTSPEHVGATGALVHWVSSAVCVTGLTLIAWAVHARCGSTQLAHLGGVGEKRPLLSAAYLLFVLACAGFPGTLGFVSEDLVLHGTLETRPLAGGVLMVATALAAIGLVRLYLKAFLGPRRAAGVQGSGAATHLPDLVPRERFAAALLLVMALGLGLSPGLLTAACARAAALSGDGRE